MDGAARGFAYSNRVPAASFQLFICIYVYMSMCVCEIYIILIHIYIHRCIHTMYLWPGKTVESGLPVWGPHTHMGDPS